ncbi:hypothetical protein GC175_11115 [bacterium]|nr:hypothetical protein [bacterium]
MSVIGTILRIVMERSSRKLTYETAVAQLEKGRESVLALMDSAADTPENRKTVRHVIGIERWGQHRLGVLKGEPLTVDEYDSYQPQDGLDMAQLRNAFNVVRGQTIELIKELETDGVPLERKVFHNDIKEFTLRGWIGYLSGHANIEMKRLKKGVQQKL